MVCCFVWVRIGVGVGVGIVFVGGGVRVEGLMDGVIVFVVVSWEMVVLGMGLGLGMIRFICFLSGREVYCFGLKVFMFFLVVVLSLDSLSLFLDRIVVVVFVWFVWEF